MATIGEQLKAARAQLAEARQGASNAVAESASASNAVLQEAKKVLKEANDLRAEVAELTNGGPPLDEPHVTPIPPLAAVPYDGQGGVTPTPPLAAVPYDDHGEVTRFKLANGETA